MCGCGRGVAALPDTGSKDAARGIYEALILRDWPQAYAALHPDSRQRLSRARFTALAQAHRRALGSEPEQVHVRACEERGAEATAHVQLSGRASGHTRRYRDGVLLRREGDAWRVVLPDRFGRQ